MNTTEEKKALIGNSFPFSLVRCERLIVEQKPISELKDALDGVEVVSFWGHENSRAAAEAVLGVSLATRGARPAVTLSPDGLPMLDGDVYSSCGLLSPDYPEGFRPAIGSEVTPEQIKGWHVLKLTWK